MEKRGAKKKDEAGVPRNMALRHIAMLGGEEIGWQIIGRKKSLEGHWWHEEVPETAQRPGGGFCWSLDRAMIRCLWPLAAAAP